VPCPSVPQLKDSSAVPLRSRELASEPWQALLLQDDDEWLVLWEEDETWRREAMKRVKRPQVCSKYRVRGKWNEMVSITSSTSVHDPSIS
jgi:hypothetical protein